MPKKIDYTLTTEELQQVEETIQTHPNLRVRNRARMIHLLHLGKKLNEVADILLSFSKIDELHEIALSPFIHEYDLTVISY